MKEPIIWFVIIGLLLFAAERLNGPQPIIIDETVENQIVSLWETQMGLPPTAQELESLLHNWIREEVFYREALRLGLDNEDTIIKRRLVQKLTFLAQEVDESDITRADLEAYYNNNIQDYTLPDRYSLSQVYYSDPILTESIRESLKANENWRKLGQSSLLPRTLVRKNLKEITSNFGTTFAQQIDQFQEGQWVGPVGSTFGLHFVRLDALIVSEITPLPFIEKQVLTDLMYERREIYLDNYYDELATQYEVKYQ